MKYRINCGRYRYFIIEADNEQQARERFDKESKSDYGKLYTTHGFTLKDVTSIVKAESKA